MPKFHAETVIRSAQACEEPGIKKKQMQSSAQISSKQCKITFPRFHIALKTDKHAHHLHEKKGKKPNMLLLHYFVCWCSFMYCGQVAEEKCLNRLKLIYRKVKIQKLPSNRVG